MLMLATGLFPPLTTGEDQARIVSWNPSFGTIGDQNILPTCVSQQIV
ncbi:hypothetical protein HanHA300_Chr08g0292251 [Helianthus annuus]|nr:hypothetical protein HanHA300_Chr08g0292251 [Helianthus annuus]KAJ0554670.1 hypothetical protein HanHA89_Chr08g0310741 [Helianthus annuus]KAJ0720232.1 hypothetical protein HanLR1_Chr08g0291021 [Helianthus annuus]